MNDPTTTGKYDCPDRALFLLLLVRVLESIGHKVVNVWKQPAIVNFNQEVMTKRMQIAQEDLESMEARSPCLGKLIEVDFLERTQRHAEEDMFRTIRERSEYLEALVVIYKDYYDVAERIDRGYPHRPSQYKRGGVIPSIGSRVLARQYHDRIRELIEHRKKKLSQIPMPADLEQREEDTGWARQEAQRLHEQELKPCHCTHCHRGF